MGTLAKAGLVVLVVLLVLLLAGWVGLFFVLRAYFREFDDWW